MDDESVSENDITNLAEEIQEKLKTAPSKVVDEAVRGKLLQRLRKATHYMPDGSKAQKPSIIGKVLGDAQLIEVWARLASAKKKGQPVYDQLAFKIQQDWGLLQDYSQWHVSRAIMFYEQRIFGLLGVAESVPELAEWAASKAKVVDKIIARVDGLEMLSNALQVQWNRINMAHDREKQLKNILPFVYKEMRTLNTLADTYLEYQLELGVFKRQPIPVDMTLRRGFDQQVKKIDQTVGRDAMLNATGKMLERMRTRKDEFKIITVDPKEVCESDDDTK